MDGIVTPTLQVDPTAEARHLEMLDELAEMGMAVARELKQRIMQPDEDIERLGVVFTRVARAVRQTVAIYARLKQDLTARGEKVQAAEEAERAQAAGREYFAQKANATFARTTVERMVEDCIRHEARGDREAEDMYEDLSDKLDAYEGYDWFAEKPIGELIDRICQDLGIEPDWARYQNEPWAVEEIRDKPEGSPFVDWSPPEPDRPGKGRRGKKTGPPLG